MAMIFALAVVLLISARAHIPENAEDRTHKPFTHRFRILSESDEPNFRHLNVSESHNRLAVQYFNKIKSAVTHDKFSNIIHKAAGYSSALPFPHMSSSDIFPQEILDALNQEIPDNPPKKTDHPDCVLGGTSCFNRYHQKSKSQFSSNAGYGPATLATFEFMQSSLFVKFLEKLTGIEGLLPDGEHKGAGIHQTLSGGFLGVHADFNLDREHNVHRRVNVFLYLNPDWKDEYGGHLELWTRDLKNCSGRIRPDMGKVFVFSTTDFTYHGHQTSLTCPPDRSRRSLAMYYYTKARPSSECIDHNCFGWHNSLYQHTGCRKCVDKKCYRQSDEPVFTAT